MSATGEDAVALLRSIDATLKALLALSQQRTARIVHSSIGPAQAVASARDLDGQYGNPVVKFMPRDWTGAPYKGRKFSECPPDLLDMLAETFYYFATKAEQAGELTDGGKPVATYKRLDAARARGWAKRMRDGLHAPPAQPAAATPSTTDSEWESGDSWR